jgi:hypothetical protein
MKIGIPHLEDIPPASDGIDYFSNVFGLPQPETTYHCPCCLYPTLPMRGGFQVCPICYWEDDGQDDQDAGRVRGGPNGHLNLIEARANFAAFGACEKRFCDKIRVPTDEEKSNRRI